jgi:hypothetical protein
LPETATPLAVVPFTPRGQGETPPVPAE